MSSSRCPDTIWMQVHDLMHPRRKRTADGTVVPNIIEYECRRCHQVVGETEYRPDWSLMARLRRQVPWSRAQSREQRRA